MNERDIPFLNELRAELRRAAQQDQEHPARPWMPTAAIGRLAAPAVVAIAVLGFVLFGLGGGDTKHRIPVNDYSSSTSYQPYGKNKFVGSPACVGMYRGRRLPPLIHRNAAPDAALVSELSTLRQPSAPIDNTSLGSWDRFPLMVTTIYQRYVRVVDGPRGVRLAFMPVDYCVETEPSRPGGSPLESVIHTTLEQGLVMLVLSNPGDRPLVLVGDAQQIKTGPAVADLDVSNRSGTASSASVLAAVVPDGVTKVLMKFTPPFLHRYSNTVQIRSNVGIVVRRPPYTPTTVVWYGASGQVIKKFVFRREIAQDNCLAHHRKTCFGPVESNATRYGIATTIPADPRAKALYQPIIAYARATTVAQRAKSGAAAGRVGGTMDACDSPYQKQLFNGLVVGSKNKVMQRRDDLYMLWNHVTLMQTYQADVAPLAPQLKQLVASWSHLSAGTKLMNEFAHAIATELIASLTDPKINGCAFVRAVAAHHFSYAWARNSSYAKLAISWWKTVSAAGNRATAFTTFVQPPMFGRSGGAGQHLFTTRELSGLFNLPGELS
jgi:hypothetical protein